MKIKLKEARYAHKPRKISIRQLSKKAGVSRSYISEIEAGIYTNPGIKFL